MCHPLVNLSDDGICVPRPAELDPEMMRLQLLGDPNLMREIQAVCPHPTNRTPTHSDHNYLYVDSTRIGRGRPEQPATFRSAAGGDTTTVHRY